VGFVTSLMMFVSSTAKFDLDAEIQNLDQPLIGPDLDGGRNVQDFWW
jgi:hypothetical protein